MPPSVSQRAAIQQFINFTGAPEKTASSLLKKYGWKVEQATDAYFSTIGSSPVPAVNEKSNVALTALFEKYRDPQNDEKDVISVDGTMTYLTELGVNLEDASSLIPLEIIQAPSLGEMTKEGFVKGWREAGSRPCDTMAKQQGHIQSLVSELPSDLALFKRVYRHTFVSSKEKDQKALPLENALIYWEMLFAPPGMVWASASTDWLKLWTQFLRENWSKSVNKDMWNQTFEFFTKTKADEEMSFWSEDGAWPGVIDEFVAYVKEKRASASAMETD